MEDFLKKVAFFGLGTAAATKEKIEQGVKKLIERGEVTAAEGKKLAKKWIADADRASKQLGRKIDAGVNRALDKAGVVRKKDVTALERRIAKLEKKLASCEAKTTKKPAAKKAKSAAPKGVKTTTIKKTAGKGAKKK